ncbi:MAG: redoxin domain-containing protein [Deltaproteobacteria bacterium]|nr:MAG: redoxin domain-containing protein [Deltaproteobacteria bacterium]
MKPMLDEYGVQVIALSKDHPNAARRHQNEDRLDFVLLCDPDLTIIREMGLLHEGALEFQTFFFGPIRFPIGWPTGFKRMAIPTTLLLDEEHNVQWIDQAEDYRIRGDAQRTEAALQHVFGPLEKIS